MIWIALLSRFEPHFNREAFREFGRQRNPRALHFERLADPGSHQSFVVRPGPTRQSVPEQTHADVRILELGTNITRQLIARQKMV
jgi:hypothetical protein